VEYIKIDNIFTARLTIINIYLKLFWAVKAFQRRNRIKQKWHSLAWAIRAESYYTPIKPKLQLKKRVRTYNTQVLQDTGWLVCRVLVITVSVKNMLCLRRNTFLEFWNKKYQLKLYVYVWYVIFPSRRSFLQLILFWLYTWWALNTNCSQRCLNTVCNFFSFYDKWR